MLTRRLTATLLALSVLLGTVPGVRAAVTSDGQADSIGRTPPRLSYTNGDVSFWRPGAQDWAPAQVNTPLAPGDELYTAHEGNLELQVGGRAFVRALLVLGKFGNEDFINHNVNVVLFMLFQNNALAERKYDPAIGK